jgi:hypothetical protein
MYEKLFDNKANLLESFYVTDGKSKLAFNLLTEDDKKVLGTQTVNQLYKSTKEKALQINYAGIELSKGDITKFKNYNDLQNAIGILEKLYNQDPSNSPSEIPKLVRCLEIFKKYKNDFNRAFVEKNEFIIMFYTNMVSALIASTALLVSSSMDYLKNVDGKTYRCVFDGKKKKASDVYVNSIERFVRMDKSGELKKLFQTGNAVYASLNEDGTVLTEGPLAYAIIVPMMVIITCRFIVFFWFYSRTKLSDYLLLISYFLEENAYNLDVSSEKGQKTQDKQLIVVAKLKRLSEILKVDSGKASKEAEKASKNDDTEMRNKQQSGGSSSSGKNDDEDILLL